MISSSARARGKREPGNVTVHQLLAGLLVGWLTKLLARFSIAWHPTCFTPTHGAEVVGDRIMGSRVAIAAPLSRRRFLKASGLAGAAIGAVPHRTRAAVPLKQVTVTLDWIYQGPNAGFMVAREKGFYREVGLDVSVTGGKGSGSTAQLVASKATQIGFADGYVVGNSVSKGMAIKTVGSIFRRNPAAVMVLADSGIRTPKDLEGKTVAMTAGGAQFQQWPAFVRGAGIDDSNIKIINIDPAGVGPALISGRADAISGFAQGYVPAIEIRGRKQVRVFWFADYGVIVVSNGIIVHDALLKSDPALVRAFVPPTIKGFLYGRQHPEEAVAIVRKYLPTIDPVISRREAELSWKTWVTPNTKGKPLGWGAEADWISTIQVLRQYGGVTSTLQTSQLYTNEFVPTGAEYVPPQEA
jgi:NitT/TauT family transport system substrate-binding protein